MLGIKQFKAKKTFAGPGGAGVPFLGRGFPMFPPRRVDVDIFPRLGGTFSDLAPRSGNKLFGRRVRLIPKRY